MIKVAHFAGLLHIGGFQTPGVGGGGGGAFGGGAALAIWEHNKMYLLTH